MTVNSTTDKTVGVVCSTTLFRKFEAKLSLREHGQQIVAVQLTITGKFQRSVLTNIESNSQIGGQRS